MNILVTINKNYLPYFISLVKSLQAHNARPLHFFIIARDVKEGDVLLYGDVLRADNRYTFLSPGEEAFRGAPVVKRYPEEIYYRILAAQLLPQEIDRALYLDCDIIVTGDLSEFYDMPFEGNYFVATTNIRHLLKRINQIKNGAKFDTAYVNTGVLLMNLALLREEQKVEEVTDYIRRRHAVFTLPDQDIISTLYGEKILLADNRVYNMSDRTLRRYNRHHVKKLTLGWVEKNTKIIHYYGRNKPWLSDYKGILDVFYWRYAEPARHSPAAADSSPSPAESSSSFKPSP